jgi:outer membrane protein TolC
MVRAAAAGRDLADARLAEARSGYYPTLQFRETVARGTNPVFAFGSRLEQGRFTQKDFALDALNDPAPLTNFRSELSTRLPVFSQFQTDAAVTQGVLGQAQAEQQRAEVQQQVRFEVIRAYYGVLVAEARRGVAEEAVATAEADSKRIRDLYETGVVVQSDLLAAQVQAAEFHQQLIQAAGDVTTAYAGLNTAMGLPVETDHRITGELSGRTYAAEPQEALLQQALAHRPDQARAELAVSSAAEEVRKSRGQYLPRVDLFGSYGGSGDSLPADSSDWTLGATLSVDLFERGRPARVGQATAGETLARAERDRTADRIRFEVVQARQQLESSRDRLGVAASVVDQAAEALRIVQDRYQEGLTTITEVLRAETTVVRARMNLLAARYDHYVGYAALLLATGRLTDVEPFAP